MSPPLPRSATDPEARADRRAKLIGWGIWVCFALGICIATLAKRDLSERTVTPEYHAASSLWWRSRPVYTEGVHGFLYLPQAAVLYTPFALMPPALEETLWRLVGIGAYAAGIWALSRRLFGERWPTAWVWGSLLALPAAIGSAANGQTNLIMGGLFALAAADLIDRRWWRVTLWLMLALACKPTALVMILLVGAIYLRPMWWRLAVGLAALAMLPLAHPDPHYAVEQYRECWAKMGRAAAPADLFQDIRGLLASFGVHEPESALTVVRLDAALATLWACWIASRRFGEPGRAMVLLALGTAYLMVFNPRTEGLSYVIVAPAAAMWAVRELSARRWPQGVFLVAFLLSTQFSVQMTLGRKNYWVRPLGALVFASLVVAEVVRGRDRWKNEPAR